MTSEDPLGEEGNMEEATPEETTESDSARNDPDGPEDTPPPKKRTYRHVENRETFGYQPTSTTKLPEPEPWVEMMVCGVLEAIHGIRDPRQFSRWMNLDVYTAVEKRARSVKLRQQTLKQSTPRPVFTLGNVVVGEPRDGVVEAAAVVHGPTRVRAVAIRMEGLDRRWLTTSFRML